MKKEALDSEDPGVGIWHLIQSDHIEGVGYGILFFITFSAI